MCINIYCYSIYFKIHVLRLKYSNPRTPTHMHTQLCVCMCVDMCVYTYTHTRTHNRTHTHKYVRRTCVCVCVDACTHTHTHISTSCTPARVDISGPTYLRHTRIRAHLWLYIQIFIFITHWNMIHTHVYICVCIGNNLKRCVCVKSVRILLSYCKSTAVAYIY